MKTYYPNKVFFTKIARHMNMPNKVTIWKDSQRVLYEAIKTETCTLKKIIDGMKQNTRDRSIKKLKFLIDHYKKAPLTNLLFLLQDAIEAVKPMKTILVADAESINRIFEEIVLDQSIMHESAEGLSEGTISNLFQVHRREGKTHNMIILLKYFAPEHDCQDLLFHLMSPDGLREFTSYKSQSISYFLSERDMRKLLALVNGAEEAEKDIYGILGDLLSKLQEMSFQEESLEYPDADDPMAFHEKANDFIKEHANIILSIVRKYHIDEELVTAVQNAQNECAEIEGVSSPDIGSDERLSRILLRCIHNTPRIHTCFHEYIGG